MTNSSLHNERTSIKRKVLIFSLILFALILIGGGIIFFISYSQVIQNSTGFELAQEIEIERIKLEASVNGEIALAIKMATSPLIIRHFQNPSDLSLRRIAFDEIEGYRQAYASGMVFWASDIDKEFYFAEDNHYTVDADDPENYWYKMTLYETERYNFNINYNPEIQKIMLWINAPVFDSNHTPIGLVGTGIDLTEFVNTIYKDNKNQGTLYFFNSLGEITGARDAALVTQKKNIKDVLGSLGEDIFSRAAALSPGEFQNFRYSGGVVALGEVPALDWYITSIQSLSIMHVFGSTMTLLFFAMIAVIAVIIVIFYLFIVSMLKPMKYMVKTLDNISVDWDLTQRLELRRNDEIGTLGEFFNTTFQKMSELLLDIKGETVGVNRSTEELTSYMNITKKDIDGINENLKHMREQIFNQSDKIIATINTIAKIMKGIDGLDKNISVQARSVEQSSSAIEEMLANINSVTQTLVMNTKNIKSLSETSDAGKLDVQKVSQDISEIAQESEGLLQINSVMQTIASQTNLLAMNAAIEAAHAGDSGRGFAVVADEIRKLAENSGKQSKTISTVLKKIKSMIDAITKSTSVVLERFEEIEKEIEIVSDLETQIRNAMEEQGEGSRQILDAVTHLNTVTEQVRSSSSIMTNESKEVSKQSEALKHLSGEIAGSIDEITHNTDEMTTAFTKVQQITKENREKILTLSGDISRFKVE